MPTESSLSKRLKPDVPDNGYESPPSEWQPIPRGGIGLEEHLGHRRHGLSSSTATNVQISSSLNMEGIFSGLGEGRSSTRQGSASRKFSVRDRIECFTWTWFTMTMATGGIANVLHSIPFRSDWLNVMGTIFFLLNIILFLFNCVMITLRFAFSPGSFSASFTDQSESLFVPASIVSTAVILTNVCQYGIPHSGSWLQSTMEILYWMYTCVSMLGSAGIYLILWSTQSFPIHNMTPIWIFPAYPLLLTAPFASNFIDALPYGAANINVLAITFGAVTLQGTGFLLSLMMYGAFLYRLMTQKLPRETLRPGMFVSVGPSGFTASGLVHLGNVLLPKVLPSGWIGNEDLAMMLQLLSNVVGLWLWGLCIWFFFVSLGAHWNFIFPQGPKQYPRFEMTWFSFVFPNTALVTATLEIGRSLSSRPLQIAGTALAGILALVWLLVFCTMLRALVLRRLLWPEDESTDDRKKEPTLGGKNGKT